MSTRSSRNLLSGEQVYVNSHYSFAQFGKLVIAATLTSLIAAPLTSLIAAPLTSLIAAPLTSLIAATLTS